MTDVRAVARCQRTESEHNGHLPDLGLSGSASGQVSACQPISVLAKICQASALLAIRLSTM